MRPSWTPSLNWELRVRTAPHVPVPFPLSVLLRVEGLKWYEIDDEADLSYAEEHIIRYC